MRIAGYIMVVNAVLHWLAGIAAGPFGEGVTMTIVGVVYALFSWALLRGIGAMAYVVFFVALFGVSAAGILMGSSPYPDILLWGIILADVSVAAVLFAHLWGR